MLYAISDLEDFTLHAAIDNIGLVKDFYFEDSNWVIKYFRIELDSRSSGSSVLISPDAVNKMNREEKTLSVNISLAQIKSSRDADTYQPICNNQLISCKTIMGFEILASDGHIGHVQEILIDEETWQIRYLVVDTSKWWFG
ncbi:MAG: PRC-barrel domain containing protein, partial [Sphingobacteriales bacterium]